MSKLINVCVFLKKSLLILSCIFLFSACEVQDEDDKKLRDIDFTVVPEANIPKELQAIIDDKKQEPFLVSYGDKENLYIAVGYGAQPTGGYSIQVEELYETENAIWIDTEFIGPSKTEDVSQSVSYPYIVVQMEYMDKQVRQD